jgi:hypothetical protein
MLGDVRRVFSHLANFASTQWAGMVWESEYGRNYYMSRAPST